MYSFITSTWIKIKRFEYKFNTYVLKTLILVVQEITHFYLLFWAREKIHIITFLNICRIRKDPSLSPYLGPRSKIQDGRQDGGHFVENYPFKLIRPNTVIKNLICFHNCSFCIKQKPNISFMCEQNISNVYFGCFSVKKGKKGSFFHWFLHCVRFQLL